MKKGEKVVCMDDIGVEEWLLHGAVYTVEARVGFMDSIPGSSEEGIFYGNLEDVKETGVILSGIYAQYDCGGRMAFKASRFRPFEKVMITTGAEWDEFMEAD